MKLVINDDIKVDLPTEYEYEERLSLVMEILDKYHLYFNYNEKMFDMKCGNRTDINSTVKYRLSALATYLITAEEDCYSSKDVMSDKKIKSRKKSELGMDMDVTNMNKTYHITA